MKPYISRRPVILLSLLLATTAHSASPPSAPGSERPKPAACTTTREYVTVLEFLRAHGAFNLLDKDAQQIAGRVSEGCTDAAQRFIRVTNVLLNAGLLGRDAMELGIEFAAKANTDADTFLALFKHAFLEDGLDMELRDALNLARSLTTELQAATNDPKPDARKIAQDFMELVDFCVRGDGLNLSRPQCGAFAARIARAGKPWGGGMAASFRKAFDFLRAEKGPRLITGQALEKAEEITAYGPGATENFIQGYQYASSSKGLARDARAAVAFATSMASKTNPLEVQAKR